VGGTAALQGALFLFPFTRRLLGITPIDRRDWTTILAGTLLPLALAMQRRHLPEEEMASLPIEGRPALPTASPSVGRRGGFRLA
jgi:hypothetical protein